MDRAQITNYWQGLPWNEIKLKANKHLPKFIVVVFVVLITQTFAEMTWSFFTPSQGIESANIQANYQTTGVNAVTNASLAKLSTYHLFGDAKKSTPVTQQKVIDAPETRLRLDLKGVFASTNASEALAIISSSKGKDKTYHIGDKIIGGALLHAVYEDRVILKRNGQFETLRLPKSKVDSKAFYKNSAPSSDFKSSHVQNTQSKRGQAQRLRKIRDTLLKDPAKIWQQVRIAPVMKNGQIHGYTMVHNDQKLMKALNIRQSDVITSINGKALSDPATLYGLMGSLSKQKSLMVDIERNGQQQTLELSF